MNTLKINNKITIIKKKNSPLCKNTLNVAEIYHPTCTDLHPSTVLPFCLRTLWFPESALHTATLTGRVGFWGDSLTRFHRKIPSSQKEKAFHLEQACLGCKLYLA